MKIQTYQLRLRPDPAVSLFRRLEFVLVDVPLADVFHRGVHPHSHTTGFGHDSWGTVDAISERLNAPDAFVPDLNTHQLGYNVTKSYSSPSWRHQPTIHLDNLLKGLRTGIVFTDDITYSQLLEVAVRRLRDTWDHAVARELARGITADFAGMRSFLKTVDPALKLTGYDSLDDYDLGRVLSVDDFLTEDRLLVLHGIDVQNFRRAQALSEITTPDGLLRLTPRIDQCCVEWREQASSRDFSIQYRCLVDGDCVQWEPDLKADPNQRSCARGVARALGSNTGRYCFETTLSTLDHALDDERFRLRFPWLRYSGGSVSWTPKAKLRMETIPCYAVPRPIDAERTNQHLQDVLRDFGWKTSGRKEQLIKRIAQLLAEQYERAGPELDAFFGARRFIRIKNGHQRWRPFSVLHRHALSSSLLTMYCLRHMRGNTILEASHHNTSVTLTDLAEAILHQRVKLTGHFVEVL